MRTVLQVTPYYPPHLGGIELVVQHLAEMLSQDHDVHVVTTTLQGKALSPPAGPTAGSSAVTLHRHHAIELAHTVVAPGLPLSLLRAPRSAIVHVHVPHALVPEQVALAARLRGQRFLVHFHGDVGPAGSLGRLLPLYKRHLFSRVLRAAAGVIALTPDQAAFVQDVYHVPAERVFTVPNGVGLEYFQPVPEPGTEPGELKLLFVGRLNVQKNVARLLDAMSLVHEPVRLTIVGDGELRAELHAQADHLGLTAGEHPRVRFTGILRDEELITAYHHAEAFVLPSDHEGMALVALEAMASALPVVATDVTGNSELLRDTGLLAPPDPRHLARAIDRLALDPALRHQLARRSRDAAAAYSWNKVADQIRDIYTHVDEQARGFTPASHIGAAG